MTVDILTGKCYPVFMANLLRFQRRKLLLAAAKLFCRQGYHGTASARYFGGERRAARLALFPFPARERKRSRRERLRFGEKAVRGFIAHVAETSRSAETFVINLARGMAANLEASDFREGCPLATTALEIATESKAIGKATREAFAAWEREIAQALVRFGDRRKQAAAAATAILSQVEGALLLARTYRSLEPMRRAEETLRLLVQSVAKT